MTVKILLVDDNQTFTTAIKLFLEMLSGTEVIGQAHNGHQALAMAEQLQPDLVLLDIAMPEMTGLEVARSLQSWPQPPRIVFLSMHESAPYRTAASDLGAVAYVGKSDFVVELLPIIQRMVADKAAGDDSMAQIDLERPAAVL